jgi:hypothetical protein
MSTKIGTLQAPSQGRSLWLAAVLAIFVVLTVAAIATSMQPVELTDAPAPGRIVAGLAGGVAANTPSELSGGSVGEMVGGALGINTPSELSGGIRHKYVGAPLGTTTPSLGITTPSELSGGGDFDRYGRHQRI